MSMRFCAACISLLFQTVAVADNWPGWRGPSGNGQATGATPPLEWSSTANIRWRASLPDIGNASPVVWGQRVFIAQAVEKGRRRGVLCFDRTTGKQLWSRLFIFAGDEPTHDTNPYGSATPATDGERVFINLGSAGLACLDFNGEELWRRNLGPFVHIWGNASSPVLYGDFCILWCGPGERQFLLAVDKKSGTDVWRVDVPGGKSGLAGSTEWTGSWSTPTVAKVNGRDELILSVPGKVMGFDPKTGRTLWSCSGLGPLVYTSPVVSPDGIVLAMSGYHGPALALKAGGNGDVTATHRLWHQTSQNPQRIGSAVILDGRAYLINEPGLASCIELETGKDLWNRSRLTGPTWGSTVLAAGRLYVTNNAGETLVLKAGPKLEVLATNRLNDRVLASPAVVDGEIFIRGYKNLWCIAQKD